MSSIFAGTTTFNQPLNSWNVSQVTDMSYLFYNATSLDQPFDLWNVSNINNMSNIFAGISLSISNYDNLLPGCLSLLIYNAKFSLILVTHNTALQLRMLAKDL